MKPNTFVIAAVVAAGIAAIGVGYIATLSGTPKGPAPDNAEIVAQGNSLYDANCASCHGADLKGQSDWKTKNPDGTLKAPPHDVSGHTWHHADSLLFQITKDGGASIASQISSRPHRPATRRPGTRRWAVPDAAPPTEGADDPRAG